MAGEKLESPQDDVDAPRSRHKLICDCQGIVRLLAWKICQKLPPYVEIDDLIGYGQVGLAQAARDFDASRGTHFTTYAYYRVRGAILDGLEQMSWFSRYDYHASRYRRCSADEGEEKDEDVSTSAGLSMGRLEAVQDGASNGRSSLVDQVHPLDLVIDQELDVILRDLISALPKDAGQLIRAAYYDGVTLTEAGRQMGISKAWTSRLHSRTLRQLARALRRRGAVIAD